MTDRTITDPRVEGASAAPSILEELAAEIKGRSFDDTESFPVPSREGYEVLFRTAIPYEDIKLARRAATEAVGGNVDELVFALTLMANSCTGIKRRGELITVGGENLTFTSPEFLALLDTEVIHDAIGKFFGRDGDALIVGAQLLRAAGYAGVVDGVSPTKSS